MRKNVLIAMAILVLMSLMVSCDQSPQTKALIISNDSASTTIEVLEIRQHLTSSRAAIVYNALADDEEIAPGEDMTFYLAPYSYSNDSHINGWSSININPYITGEAEVYFYFDPDVDEDILASYDGTSITLSGSDVEIPAII